MDEEFIPALSDEQDSQSVDGETFLFFARSGVQLKLQKELSRIPEDIDPNLLKEYKEYFKENPTLTFNEFLRFSEIIKGLSPDNVTDFIIISSTGLSIAFVFASLIFLVVSIPDTTFPNTVCRLSR